MTNYQQQLLNKMELRGFKKIAYWIGKYSKTFRMYYYNKTKDQVTGVGFYLWGLVWFVQDFGKEI